MNAAGAELERFSGDAKSAALGFWRGGPMFFRGSIIQKAGA